jgi:hypothetical protein
MKFTGTMLREEVVSEKIKVAPTVTVTMKKNSLYISKH